MEKYYVIKILSYFTIRPRDGSIPVEIVNCWLLSVSGGISARFVSDVTSVLRLVRK